MCSNETESESSSNEQPALECTEYIEGKARARALVIESESQLTSVSKAYERMT